MNRADVINRVSVMSKVDVSDCEKVINALEKVLENEIGSSNLSNALAKFYKLIKIFKIKTR